MQRDLLEKFEPREVRHGRGRIGYRLLKPRGYDPGRRWPLILFLHGAGERGSDNTVQLKHFAPQIAADAMMARHPCFVIMPQLPQGTFWASLPLVPTGERVGHYRARAAAQPSPFLRLAIAALDEVAGEFAIDPARIYLTGISMGGYGTWDALWRWPERFAAAAPVCGGGDPDKAARIAQKPIWAFHGDADDIVPVTASRVMIEAVRKAGGNPRYTEYPGVGHDSWTPSYANPEFYDWLFSMRIAE